MPKFATVADYFQAVNEPHLSALQQLRDIILAAAPKAEEVISYGMPAVKQNDVVLVYYAANKTQLGFYPTPAPLQEFQEQLIPYHVSKGAVSFAYDQPLPVDLIAAMVKSRIAAVTPQAEYQFTATIHHNDSERGGSYVIFPYDVRQEFGKGRAKVAVTFDSIPYNGSIVNMGLKNPDGSICYIIGLLKSIQAKLHKTAGDEVMVTVKPRE